MKFLFLIPQSNNIFEVENITLLSTAISKFHIKKSAENTFKSYLYSCSTSNKNSMHGI